MALPKLYTQVLHLMNKMNLPPPFEDDAIPGMFSKQHETAASQRQKRPRTGASVPKQQLVEEDDEDADGESKSGEVQEVLPQDLTQVKRRRTEESSSVPPPLLSQLSLITAPQRKHLLGRSSAFSEDVGHAFVVKQDLSQTLARRPGVISKEELLRQKLPESGIVFS